MDIKGFYSSQQVNILLETLSVASLQSQSTSSFYTLKNKNNSRLFNTIPTATLTLFTSIFRVWQMVPLNVVFTMRANGKRQDML